MHLFIFFWKKNLRTFVDKNIAQSMHHLTHFRRLCKTTEIFVRIENVFFYLIYIYIYVHNIYGSLYTLSIYMYLFIYSYVMWKQIGRFFILLLFWNECSTLVLLCPFIRHPLSKFTLRPWKAHKHSCFY